jgi:phosphatidylglycerophosphate synthase
MTLAGGACSIASAWSIINDYRWAAFFLFTAYHMLDNMDGKQARRTNQSSEIGAILDHFCDGCFGILAGAIGLQYALDIPQKTIAFGVLAFTMLFYTVHTVHAFSGFFEIGNDYISIDEAFIFLSLVFALHAFHIKVPYSNSELAHYAIIGLILFMTISWIVMHGKKINFKRMGRRFFMVLPGVLYFSWMASGGFSYCLEHGVYASHYILWTFAIPYAFILWESKDKH